MTQREDLAVLTFIGKDAEGFLHNQLTADVKNLAVGDCTFASLCQPKGRVMALLLVTRITTGFQAICARPLAAGLIAYLTRFRFREQLELQVDDGLMVLSGEGNAGHSGLEPVAGLGYEIAENAESASGDQDAARAAELALGVVWLDEATTEQFLPQMLGQEAIGALNFRKGCFPGQEIIARTRYLGKLKRHAWTGTVPNALPVQIMGDVSLSDGTLEGKGVLVAQAEKADGTWQVFVVARRTEAFEVNTVNAGEASQTASGNWLTPESTEETDPNTA